MELEGAEHSQVFNENPNDIDLWLECDRHYSSVECPINGVLDLISHKWSVQIIYYLRKNEVVRFGHLHRLVAPITQKELTKRLRELEYAGLVNRTVYAEIPPRVEYQLTDLGKTLIKPIVALSEWAEQNYDTVVSHQNQVSSSDLLSGNK
jgi:DNA-binding HxlR family transcriptional regulator